MSSPDLSEDPIELVVGESDAGMRLDALLAARFPIHGRTHLRRAIVTDAVTVDGRRAKPAYRLRPGQRIRVVLPERPRSRAEPEDIPLTILYEDEAMVAVDKSPGMVVHPARGHWSGTLTAALAFHFDSLSSVGGPTRPGIVHRLDRDTSGVIVVAKTDAAHVHLAAQFENREVEKEYFALVAGCPELDRDRIDLPIANHPDQREKMAIRRDHPKARHAETFYETTERFDGFAAVTVRPKTGRTHQIRVHLSSIGHPVLCDRLYGGRASLTRGELRRDPSDLEVLLARQALHARRIRLRRPIDNEILEITAPIPPDILAVLDALRRWRR